MTRESPHWTQETKLLLESQLLLATEGPLCLDPSIEVAQVANQLQFNKNKFNTRGIRRYIVSFNFQPLTYAMVVKASKDQVVNNNTSAYVRSSLTMDFFLSLVHTL